MAPGIVAGRRVDPARIGMKQVLEFVWVDLDTLRDGALHDLRYDLIVFTVGIGATFQLAPEQLSKPLLRQLQREVVAGHNAGAGHDKAAVWKTCFTVKKGN